MLRICKNIVTNKDNFKGFVSLTDENFNKFTQDLTGYFKATQVNGNSWTYEFTPGTFYNYDGELIEWDGWGSVSFKISFQNTVTVYGSSQPNETHYCYLNYSSLSSGTIHVYRIESRPTVMDDLPYVCSVTVPESGEITLDMIISEVPNILIQTL